MITYLKLIRFQNLLFISFIQLVIQNAVILPILQTFGFETAMSTDMLSLLVLSTTLIAAGGYALNDYFDIKIDAINKPHKQIVGNVISRKNAIFVYQFLTAVGVFGGLLLSYFAQSFTLAFIFIVVPGLLWFYSASYKRQFMIGNLVVAFLAALVILIIGIAQMAFLKKEFGMLIFETEIPKHIYGWIGGFSVFSFLMTWIREIIKDMEDEKGDREMECRTLAIKWGIAKTKLFVYCLIIIGIAGLFLIHHFYIHFEGSLTVRYIIFGFVFPFIALSYLIFTAKTPLEFHQASTLSKIIMIVGVLYSFVFYYLQAKTYGISLFNIFILK